MEVLTMAQERRAKGFATHEFEDAGLVRTWVSELREEGHEFVMFELPGVSASRYALSQFVGTKHDGYMALRAVHPDAKVKRDDRLPSKRKPMAAPFEESPRAEQARRSAGTRAHQFRRMERAGHPLGSTSWGAAGCWSRSRTSRRSPRA